MRTSTVRLYWKVVAVGSIAGIALAVAALAIFYSTFARGFTWANVGDSLRWGVLVGLLTTAMATTGTLVTARRLDTAGGKALFILLSFLSPLLGWLLVGVIDGVIAGWDFFFGFPWIAAAAGIAAALIAAVSTLFMPPPPSGGSTSEHAVEELLGLE
jgi:hypothetical protein